MKLKTLLASALISSFSLLPLSSVAENNKASLDSLLSEVRANQKSQVVFDRKREALFKSREAERAKMLANAVALNEKQKEQNELLTNAYDEYEKILAEVKEKLRIKSGDLGEVFGTVRQVAGELSSELQESLISAQLPGRSAKIAQIAEGSSLPTSSSLEEIWFVLQQEMTESGKVARFEANVVNRDGAKQKQSILRIGPFNAITDAAFLRYVSEKEQLVEPRRQPSGSQLSLAEEFFESSNEELLPVVIDPTRGTLISLLREKPNVMERISQGGWIGYFILCLGAVGVVVAIVRVIVLFGIDSSVKKQMASLNNLSDDNPLGRVLLVDKSNTVDMHELESRLDEAILNETPVLERGQSVLKLFAATAPLLGLLGTVTGMIATFQSITLYGTGDPKLMASGISQALVTTMLGLLVAIPLLFLNSLLLSRSKALTQILYQQAAGLVVQRKEAQEQVQSNLSVSAG